MPLQAAGLTLYTVEEVAELFQVHRNTIFNYLRSGRLPGRKLGRRWYIAEQDLRAYFGRATREVETSGN